jgi:hypothetical protein
VEPGGYHPLLILRCEAHSAEPRRIGYQARC